MKLNIFVFFVAFGLVGMSFANVDGSDQIWQLQEWSSVDREVGYWTLQKDNGKTRVWKGACEDKEPLGSASSTKEGFAITLEDSKALEAIVESSGKVLVKEKGSTLATGRVVKSLKCEDGFPSDIVFENSAQTADEGLSAFASRLLSTDGQSINQWDGFKKLDAQDLQESSIEIESGKLRCINTPVQEQSARYLLNTPLFTRHSQIWPGALLRGNQLSQGKFASISIKRSGGEIRVQGIEFEKGVSNLAAIDEMTMGKVEQSKSEILARKRLKTAPNSEFKVFPVYSNRQVAFALGLDERFSNTSLESALRLDDPAKNYVLAYYTQTYYTVNYEPPSDIFTVFRDGKDFKDRDYQVGSRKEGEVNPPLYVSDVRYGRQVFVLAGSNKYSHEEIEGALKSIWEKEKTGKEFSDKDSASYKKILDATTLSYLTVGGSSVSALQPIKASGSNDMFNAVVDFIKEEEQKGAADSSGLPIAFTVKYLLSGDVVSMGFYTNYVRKTCTIEKPGVYSFWFQDMCEKSATQVSVVDKETGKEVIAVSWDAKKDLPINLDPFIAAKDSSYLVRILESEINDDRCNRFVFKRTHPVDSKHKARNPQDKIVTDYLTDQNELVAVETVMGSTAKQLGQRKRSDFQILVNPITGAVQITGFDSQIPKTNDE